VRYYGGEAAQEVFDGLDHLSCGWRAVAKPEALPARVEASS
jgi:hypothetical protein